MVTRSLLVCVLTAFAGLGCTVDGSVETRADGVSEETRASEKAPAPPLPPPAPSTATDGSPADPVSPSASIKRVATGWYGSCAVVSDGTVRCWGMFEYVESPPHVMPNLVDIREIAIGGDVACALADSGTVQCWGRNSCYQLGNFSGTYSEAPRSISEVDGMTALTVNIDGSRALARRPDGSLLHWGTAYDWMGGCANSNLPASLGVAANVVAMAGAGDETFAALSSDGTLRTWGEWKPVATVPIANVASLSDGGSCAVLQGGSVTCWKTSDPSSIAPLPGLQGVVSMSGGAASGCAVLGDRTVRCWGPNAHGQVGDGTTTDRSSPTPVVGLTNVASVSTSGTHSCALLADGRVQCWGQNDCGQLGDGTKVDHSTPVAVAW